MDNSQRPVAFDEFHHMMGECHTLGAVARAADARLSEYEGSDESDEIQDVKLLLAIVETKAKSIVDFLDDASVRLPRSDGTAHGINHEEAAHA